VICYTVPRVPPQVYIKICCNAVRVYPFNKRVVITEFGFGKVDESDCEFVCSTTSQKRK
jgi:hypothetical protein